MGSPRLRPVDLAREHGLSTQAVRNYEDASILPPAQRSAYGYRAYSATHARALRAFLALVPGFGHATATAIMQAVNEQRVEQALELIDAGHAQLRQDRQTLTAVEHALRDLAGPEPATGSSFVGPLARRLGVRPATLRKWERAGLLRPHRDRTTGYRVYAAADIRDAQLAHQLRRGGYPLDRIALLLDQVRTAGGVEPLEATLADWRARLTRRGRAMLAGAGRLDAYLSIEQPDGHAGASS
ncbi:DNA-binding transcriptional MerR regulator [Hamadaea flava]|uniref:TioE family transcriptional regulator n=1 Tax=Hamadaea flava TaxID=1742688 RepID=A0ABV8M073_9ACTN|nr:TioE family transcriptional regulator [Hamadaea flava]MCP2328924.1 DNA-binding transcriptional MerR regulator [Hamadaea flava]